MPARLPAICFVAPNAYPVLAGDEGIEVIGGAELQQVVVAKGLAARGYRVSMICLDFGQEDEVEIGNIRVLRAFRSHEGIPVLRFVWPRLTSIWSCLERAAADIYYQRTAGMLTGVVAAFCRRSGKKSIFAAAGNPDMERNTPRIRYARDRWIYEYGLRNVDRILVQNEEQQRLCQANFGRDAIKVPNCYPTAEGRHSTSSTHVLWVSTIRRIKRPDLFLDLAEAMPEHRFRMIGGPGSEEEVLFESIRSRAASIRNVEFLGFVPIARIGSFFEAASVFVNTSESEGFPNTFLQAWASGVPTVSFVECGARAADGPVGRQVRTPNEMTEQVSRWLLNESERAREGERSRRYFEANHSPMRVLDIYERVFEGLSVRGQT